MVCECSIFLIISEIRHTGSTQTHERRLERSQTIEEKRAFRDALLQRLQDTYGEPHSQADTLRQEIIGMGGTTSKLESSKEVEAVLSGVDRKIKEIQEKRRQPMLLNKSRVVEEILKQRAERGARETGIIGATYELASVANEKEAKIYANFIKAKFQSVLFENNEVTILPCNVIS